MGCPFGSKKARIDSSRDQGIGVPRPRGGRWGPPHPIPQPLALGCHLVGRVVRQAEPLALTPHPTRGRCAAESGRQGRSCLHPAQRRPRRGSWLLGDVDGGSGGGGLWALVASFGLASSIRSGQVQDCLSCLVGQGRPDCYHRVQIRVVLVLAGLLGTVPFSEVRKSLSKMALVERPS